jgi:hypothetical protein
LYFLTLIARKNTKDFLKHVTIEDCSAETNFFFKKKRWKRVEMMFHTFMSDRKGQRERERERELIRRYLLKTKLQRMTRNQQKRMLDRTVCWEGCGPCGGWRNIYIYISLNI